jgi:molecular chaperone GrpE (heat shock protein)
MSEEPKGFTVKDRRFWAQGNGEAAGGNGDGQPPPGEEPSPQFPTFVEQLRAELAEKDRQLREYIAAYKEQVVKGIDDTKARLEREQQKEIERLRGRLVGDLLEVLDNLDRSLEAVPPQRHDAFIDGVRLVRDQFLAKLQALGLNALPALGQRFDPNRHEAIGLVPVTEPEQDGVVMNVVRAGYSFGDKVLRPAVVQVGKLAS